MEAALTGALSGTALGLPPMREAAAMDATQAPLDLIPAQNVPPASLTDTAFDLIPVRDDVPVSDDARVPGEVPSADAADADGRAGRPETPGAEVRDTAFDLIPVRDDPSAPGDGQSRDDIPAINAEGMENIVRPLPIEDAPSAGLTQTSLDLIPVRGLSEDEHATYAWARPAVPGADVVPMIELPGAGRGRPRAARWRLGGGGRGVHAGRAGDPWETNERRRGFRRSSGSRRRSASGSAPVPEQALLPEHAHRASGPRTLPVQGNLSVSMRLAAPRRPAAPRPLAGWRSAWRPAAGASMAGVVLATAVPLCLLQVPYVTLPQLASAGATSAQAGGSAAALRAASLALPIALAFAPLAALAVRRLRAWPVLLAGLIVTVAGNALAGPVAITAASVAATGATGATGAHPAVGGVLHGIGAGLAIPATVALVTERTGWPRRLLAAWWAAVTIAALAAAPGLTLSQHQGSGWRTALGPVPWLTIAALAALAMYELLSGAQGRIVVPSAERTRLPLLAPPAAVIAVAAVAATYRPDDTLGVAAVCAAAGLIVMTAMVVRRTGRDGLGLACAVAGFALAPASAGLAGLRTVASTGTAPAIDGSVLTVAAVTGAIAGAGIALVTGRAAARAAIQPVSLVPAAGLLLAGVALVAASITGPFAGSVVLAVLTAAVTGGLAAALARLASQATTARAMACVIVLAGGALTGYLTAGAIRVGLAPAHAAATGSAVQHALASAANWWELLAAAAAVAGFGVCARRAHMARAMARAMTRAGARSGERARMHARPHPHTHARPRARRTPAGGATEAAGAAEH